MVEGSQGSSPRPFDSSSMKYTCMKSVICRPKGMYHIKTTGLILNSEGLYKCLHQETGLQKKKQQIRE